jgi:hypothetical protein
VTSRVIHLCQSEAKNDSRSGGKCLVQDHCALRPKSWSAIIGLHADDFDPVCRPIGKDS